MRQVKTDHCNSGFHIHTMRINMLFNICILDLPHHEDMHDVHIKNHSSCSTLLESPWNGTVVILTLDIEGYTHILSLSLIIHHPTLALELYCEIEFCSTK